MNEPYDNIITTNNSSHSPNSYKAESEGSKSKGGQPTKDQRLIAYVVMSIYAVTFMFLMIAALITQNFFLLSYIPLMAKELAYTFRRAIDFLLSH